MTAIGALVFLAGAAGAGLAVPRLQRAGRGRLIPGVLVAFGAMVGSGAAMVRGWDAIGTGLAGAVLLPLFAIVTRLIEVRRRGTGADGDADLLGHDEGERWSRG